MILTHLIMFKFFSGASEVGAVGDIMGIYAGRGLSRGLAAGVNRGGV